MKELARSSVWSPTIKPEIEKKAGKGALPGSLEELIKEPGAIIFLSFSGKNYLSRDLLLLQMAPGHG